MGQNWRALKENTDKIVAEFMLTHGDVIEGVIADVEARGLSPMSFTEVVDLVFPMVLSFPKERGGFLDKPLSPYAGLPRRSG